jgi:uncharacterized membrane protein
VITHPGVMDILSASTSLAGELLQRTSSTVRVQQVVQLSLTPAFFLAAIGAFLNVMNQRLTWLVDRVHVLERAVESNVPNSEIEELPVLRQRRWHAHLAINLSTAAGLLICVVVALTFVSAFVRPPLGTVVALCWIVATTLVFGALLFFLLETRLATKSTADTRRISRKLATREKDPGEGETADQG